MALAISGNVRSRFLEIAVLLHLIDPVRGEPSAHGLDQDSHGAGISREAFLKRKFLDSFALICAIKRDGDSVSAACIEDSPDGTTLRVASNSGISDHVLIWLQELVVIFNDIGSGKLIASTAEADILSRIVELNAPKIRHYLKDFAAAKDVFELPMETIEKRLEEMMSPRASSSTYAQFIERLRQLPHDFSVALDPATLRDYVIWSEEARQHLDTLKHTFAEHMPGGNCWISSVLKLGRYSIASKCFVRLAHEFPALFNPMKVERIPVLTVTPFNAVEAQDSLKKVLRRVVGERDGEEIIVRLGRIWNTQDPEAYFRRSCSLNLTVHAEMQLLAFYDHNPELKPAFKFMGVSKKSCFLCHRFLMAHPESFAVSSCHQKLYTSWIPPPASDAGVYKTYKGLTHSLSVTMESTAKKELVERLGSPRRPVPKDSTAGVSISGLIAPNTTAVVVPEPIVQVKKMRHHQKEKRVMDGSLAMGMAQMSLPRSLPSIADVDSSYGDAIMPVTDMVFHFTRADNADKQDIVCFESIMCPLTNRPSWTRLVEIIGQQGDFDLGFTEGRDFFLINEKVRVANERQFLAAVRYLYNLQIWTSEVSVDSFDRMKQKGVGLGKKRAYSLLS